MTWVMTNMTYSKAMKQQLAATAITPKSLVYYRIESFRQSSSIDIKR